MATLHIIRGWQGSGKSTKAMAMAAESFQNGFTAHHFEADMYFERSGEYKFDATKLKHAHKWCQDGVDGALAAGIDNVIVANTFRTAKEILPYLSIAEKNNATVFVYECTGEYQNVHGVPQEIVEKYKKDFVKNSELKILPEFADVMAFVTF
jgi:hypothetical protein